MRGSDISVDCKPAADGPSICSSPGGPIFFWSFPHIDPTQEPCRPRDARLLETLDDICESIVHNFPKHLLTDTFNAALLSAQFCSVSIPVTMAGPSPHKPRRKAKRAGGNGPSNLPVIMEREALVRVPSFPLAAFLWPARSSVSQWELLPLILMVVGLFRWAAGLWGYSGKSFTILLRP